MADHPDTPEQYQPEPTGMYELEFPAPQLSAADGRGPVLLHALEGFSDAGHVVRLSVAHLKNSFDTELVASFAIDELLDYRSRRPLMTFKSDHFSGYEEPELNLYAVHDSVGTPFLLLAGMEPDLRWERFITAVRLLSERLAVRRVIGLGYSNGANILASVLAARPEVVAVGEGVGDDDAAVDVQARLFREFGVGADAGGHHDEIGRQLAPVAQQILLEQQAFDDGGAGGRGRRIRSRVRPVPVGERREGRSFNFCDDRIISGHSGFRVSSVQTRGGRVGNEPEKGRRILRRHGHGFAPLTRPGEALPELLPSEPALQAVMGLQRFAPDEQEVILPIRSVCAALGLDARAQSDRLREHDGVA